jgi:hypothetical protein
MSEHHCDCNHNHEIDTPSDENGEEVVKFKFVEGMQDRSIIIDDRLHELVDLVEEIMVDIEEIPQASDTLFPIGETSMSEDQLGGKMGFFFNFKWAYSIEGSNTLLTKEKLLELDLPNNLDSLIEYDDGFNIPGPMMFGLFGGISEKLGNVKNLLIYSTDGPTGKSKYYIQLNQI